MFSRYSIPLAALLFSSAAALGMASVAKPPIAAPSVSVGQPPMDLPGLPQVSRLSDKLYNGGLPEGEPGFTTLQRLGVKTVISVDGMRPDVETARKYGLRYVHLPFGYDGCPTPQAHRIAKAIRDLPGPIYIHCHHGKHRSPTASAVARIAVDGLSPEQAVREMERMGTGKNYTGLYASVRDYRPLSNAELDRLPAEFPEVAPTPPMVEAMVAIEKRFSRLQSGTLPATEQAHEALQLLELYTELNRTEEVRTHSGDFRQQMREAETQARQLDSAIRAGQETKARRIVVRLATGCATCHKQYRDVPQSPSK